MSMLLVAALWLRNTLFRKSLYITNVPPVLANYPAFTKQNVSNAHCQIACAVSQKAGIYIRLSFTKHRCFVNLSAGQCVVSSVRDTCLRITWYT